MSRSDRTSWLQPINSFYRFWPLVIPIFLFLPRLGSFPYPSPEAAFSDMSLTHYPYAIYLRQSLLIDHRIPLWCSLIFSGAPFAANPLSGLWYPPGWIGLLFPLPLGFNLLVAAHLFWGGVGLYILLRKEGLDYTPAIFGGLVFMALPKFFAHYGAGHLTLLYAVPWTPWLLAASNPSQTRSIWHSILLPTWEPVILALIFIADPRWSVCAGLLWAAYSLCAPIAPNESVIIRPIATRSAGLILRTCWALLLAAPLILPLAEFAGLSTRAEMAQADRLAYSLPISRLLGLAVPDFHGFHEYMLYLSQSVLLLAILAPLFSGSRRETRFWLSVFLISLLISLGENFPPYNWLTGLPGISWLRVPARALFVSGLAAAALASYALERMSKPLDHSQTRRAGLLAVGYAGFLIALFLGVTAIAGSSPLNFGWAAALASFLVIWILLRLNGKISHQIWLGGLIALCLIDLGVMNRSLFVHRPKDLVLAEGGLLAEEIQRINPQGDFYRIYSPSYSIPQQTAAFKNLELADGVDPLHLKTYSDFMVPASGVPAMGYAVSIPPFSSGDPSKDNEGYLPDPGLLGLLNVRFIASAFDLITPDLEYKGQVEETRTLRKPQGNAAPVGLLGCGKRRGENRPAESNQLATGTDRG